MNNDAYMVQGPFSNNINNQQPYNQNMMPRPIDITDYVSGFNGASNYPIPIGRSGLLVDFSIGKMWLKTPGSPQPMIEFNISRADYPQYQQPIQQIPHQTSTIDNVSREEFNEAINSFGSSIEQIKEMIANMQNSQTGDQSKPNNKRYNNQKG